LSAGLQNRIQTGKIKLKKMAEREQEDDQVERRRRRRSRKRRVQANEETLSNDDQITTSELHQRSGNTNLEGELNALTQSMGHLSVGNGSQNLGKPRRRRGRGKKPVSTAANENSGDNTKSSGASHILNEVSGDLKPKKRNRNRNRKPRVTDKASENTRNEDSERNDGDEWQFVENEEKIPKRKRRNRRRKVPKQTNNNDDEEVAPKRKSKKPTIGQKKYQDVQEVAEHFEGKSHLEMIQEICRNLLPDEEIPTSVTMGKALLEPIHINIFDYVAGRYEYVYDNIDDLIDRCEELKNSTDETINGARIGYYPVQAAKNEGFRDLLRSFFAGRRRRRNHGNNDNNDNNNH
jgi:flagellum-specific peptidoglycan hydrolase FlgJ